MELFGTDINKMRIAFMTQHIQWKWFNNNGN